MLRFGLGQLESPTPKYRLGVSICFRGWEGLVLVPLCRRTVPGISLCSLSYLYETFSISKSLSVGLCHSSSTCPISIKGLGGGQISSHIKLLSVYCSYPIGSGKITLLPICNWKQSPFKILLNFLFCSDFYLMGEIKYLQCWLHKGSFR